MKVARSVAEIPSQHTTLALECIDRLNLNVYVPVLQRAAGAAYFFREVRGASVPSSALMAPMTQRFVAAIRRYAEGDGIDIVSFRRGERKDERTQGYLRQWPGGEGVLYRQAPRRWRRPLPLLTTGLGSTTSGPPPGPRSRSAATARRADAFTLARSAGSGRPGQWSGDDSAGRTAAITRAPHRSQRQTLTRNPRVHRCAHLPAVSLIAARLPRTKGRRDCAGVATIDAWQCSGHEPLKTLTAVRYMSSGRSMASIARTMASAPGWPPSPMASSTMKITTSPADGTDAGPIEASSAVKACRVPTASRNGRRA